MIHEDDGNEGLPPWMQGGIFLPNIIGPVKNPELQVLRQAEQVINTVPKVQIDSDTRERLIKNIDVANLWLSEASSLTEVKVPCEILTRDEWVRNTARGWLDLTSPISSVIASKLIQQAQHNLPESLKPLISQLSQAMQQVSKASLLVQVGNAAGNLSLEVLSGCDVGIPLLESPKALIVPENVVKFASDFHLPLDEAGIYLACREIAYACVLQHCAWIKSRIFTSIHSFSKSMSVDNELMDINDMHFDAASALTQITGTIKFEPNEQQLNALRVLEDQLAILEGWVSTVTTIATSRLPHAGAINETIVRRRAGGGPAEKALSSLIGIDLHPRRLRASQSMWNKITQTVGPYKRDSLWGHPDLVPTSHDIDDPEGLIKRLSENKSDKIDDELSRLLDSEIERNVKNSTGDDEGDTNSNGKDASKS